MDSWHLRFETFSPILTQRYLYRERFYFSIHFFLFLHSCVKLKELLTLVMWIFLIKPKELDTQTLWQNLFVLIDKFGYLSKRGFRPNHTIPIENMNWFRRGWFSHCFTILKKFIGCVLECCSIPFQKQGPMESPTELSGVRKTTMVWMNFSKSYFNCSLY